MGLPDDPTHDDQDCMRSINELYSSLPIMIVAALLLAFTIG